MSRLKMVQPRLKTLPPRLKMAPPLPREPKAKATGREADSRRAIPLNSHAWRKLRAYILTESPLCEHCAERGITIAATDVDHVNGDPSDNSMANLQSLCHSCHSIKTAADHGKQVSQGCDLNGWPAGKHHWNE